MTGGPIAASQIVSAADLVARKDVPASYTIWFDGTNYHADSMIGGTDYSGTNFGSTIRSARTALGAGGGKIFVKGGNQTYTFTDSETAGGAKTVGLYLMNNQTLEIESGATITQANNLVLSSLLSNQFFDGGGTNTNMKVFCYGWLDGNVANQGSDPGGSAFWNGGCSFYNTDHSEFYVKGKNLGKYGTLALQGSYNRVWHTWLESATDSTNQVSSLFLTGGSPESHDNTIDFVGGLTGIACNLENGGYNYTIGKVHQNGGTGACTINQGHDIIIDEILCTLATNTLLMSGAPLTAPQEQRVSIGKIIAYKNKNAALNIGSGGGLSSVYRLYLNIGNLIGIDNGTVNNDPAILLNSWFSNITVQSLFSTDDQGTTTQNFGIQIPANCDSIQILGGYNKNNRSLPVNLSALPVPTNSKLVNMTGFNPVGLIASPFDNTNNVIGYLGALGSSTLISAKTYTCTIIPLDIYLAGGTVTAVTKNGTSLATSLPALPTPLIVHLEPGDTFSITFSVTPTTQLVFGY